MLVYQRVDIIMLNPSETGTQAKPNSCVAAKENWTPEMRGVASSLGSIAKLLDAVGTKISTAGLKVPLRPPSGPVT